MANQNEKMVFKTYKIVYQMVGIIIYNSGNKFVTFHCTCRPQNKTVKYNTLKVSKSARSKKAFSMF